MKFSVSHGKLNSTVDDACWCMRSFLRNCWGGKQFQWKASHCGQHPSFWLASGNYCTVSAGPVSTLEVADEALTLSSVCTCACVHVHTCGYHFSGGFYLSFLLSLSLAWGHRSGSAGHERQHQGPICLLSCGDYKQATYS